MEIIKVFSDIEGDERLYSVLMNEEELVLFSEIQREFTGSVKRANKASRRAWEINTGKRLKDLDKIFDDGLGIGDYNPKNEESIEDLIRRSRKGNIKYQRGVKKIKGQKVIDTRSLADKN